MRRNRIFFTILAAFPLFLFSGEITAADYLSPDSFFTFREGTLITEKEIPVPAEAVFLQEATGLPEDTAAIDKKLWKEGTVLKDFHTYPHNNVPLKKSSAALCFDKNYLYVAFRAEKSSDYRLKAREHKTEEGGIWSDDNFEIFLDPFLSRSEYYHLIVNPLGEIYDARCLERLMPDPKAVESSAKIAQVTSDISWESDAYVRTDIGVDCWSMLVKIPFAAFGFKTVPAGSSWGINLCHTNWENNELSQWTVTGEETGGFHQPRKFPVVILGEGKNDITASFGLPLTGYGENILHLRFDNQSRGKRGIIVLTLSDSEGRKLDERKQNIIIRQGKTETAVPFFIPMGKKNEFQVTSWVTAEGFSTCFVKNLYIPEPLDVELELSQIYTTDKEINGVIRLNLGEGSFRNLRLRFEITGKDNKKRFTELKDIKYNHLKFGVNTAMLSEGDYTLRVTAAKGATNTGSCSVKISVVNPPFGF